MRVRVFIATTEGPVAVDRIVASPLGKSVVFEQGGKTPLPEFSSRYNDFVRKRIGQVVEGSPRGAYRLNISKRIDTGDSWQLAVLVAHVLHEVDRLAGPEHEHEAAATLLATGEIEYGLSVGAVGYIEEKLRTSYARLTAAARTGQRVIVALPDGNATDGWAEQEALREVGLELIRAGQARELLQRLDLRLPQKAGETEDAWEGSPFRGLAVFERRHRKIFFGRGKAREEALRQLRQQSREGCAFLLIHGGSGVGKSSLARAGLLGDIEQMATAPEPWRTAVLVPGRGELPVLAALAEALVDAVPELVPHRADLLEAMRTNPASAVDLVATSLATKPAGGRTRLALLVDQMEELLLWARAQDSREAAEQRELFVEMLGRLARSGAVWVLATLRSDLFPLIDDSPNLSQLASSARLYRLERPSRATLLEVVKRPAEVAGLRFAGSDAEGLPFADVLVEAGAKSPDSLPLLQFVLERLYEREGRSGTIRYDTYRNIGELTKAIGEWAEATVLELGADGGAARAVDDVIFELGQPDGESGTIIARTAVLDARFLTPARAQVIDALAKARLLVLDTAGGHRTARVAHEALLTNWPRARALFASRKVALELRERLKREAKEWRDKGEDPTYLLPAGPRLAAAQHLLADSRIYLPEELRAFVERSIEKDTRDKEVERQRREERLAERRRQGERERLRLATDRQKIDGHLKLSEYGPAADILEEVVGYLDHPDTELAAERPAYRALAGRIRPLAAFFADMKQVLALAGEEDFRSAHSVCERALTSLSVLDDPRWWEHLPTADLATEQVTHVKQEVYRLLLLFSGLQLVPAIVALFPKNPGDVQAPRSGFNPAALAKWIPDFVLSAVIGSGGIGPFKLPRRQDRPEALAELDKSSGALDRARQFEEALCVERHEAPRNSRTSHLVGQVIAMLRELASGPKDAPIDYRAWLHGEPFEKPPEPVNGADYFYVGLFNYFVAMRRDAFLAKITRLFGGRFPDLDGRKPFHTAERLLRAGIAMEPHNYWPHWVLGRTLLVSGDPRGAELAFNTAIALEPRYARGYEQRALSLARQWARSHDSTVRARAEADSDMALAVAEGDPSVYWPRGELLEQFGQTRAALQAYWRWLALEDNVLSKISRGSGIVHLGDFAARVLGGSHGAGAGQVLKADAHALLALVHLIWSRNGDAMAEAEAGLVLDPDHGNALAVKGVALLRGNEFVRAIEALEQALARAPSNHFAAFHRARACERICADDAALAAWRALKSAGVAGTPNRCPPWMLHEADVAEKRILAQLTQAQQRSVTVE